MRNGLFTETAKWDFLIKAKSRYILVVSQVKIINF